MIYNHSRHCLVPHFNLYFSLVHLPIVYTISLQPFLLRCFILVPQPYQIQNKVGNLWRKKLEFKRKKQKALWEKEIMVMYSNKTHKDESLSFKHWETRRNLETSKQRMIRSTNEEISTCSLLEGCPNKIILFCILFL